MIDVYPGSPDRVRAALRQIVSDYGQQALSAPATLSNALNNVLSDEPRMCRMLIAAAQDGVANSLHQRMSQGASIDTALTLVTASFATSAMFTPEASAFVVSEFARALGLTSEPADNSSPNIDDIPLDASGGSEPETVASRPDWRRRRVIAPIGGVVAAGAITATLLATGVIGGPSYPHSWCGPVLAQLHKSGGTQQALLSGLRQTRRQDHAPVGNLLNDLYSYDTARAIVQNGSNMNIMSDLANEGAALQVVASDLRNINRECAQPPKAYKHDDI